MRWKTCLLSIPVAATFLIVSPGLHAQANRLSFRIAPKKPAAQPQSLAGTWLLTGEAYASGAPLPAVAKMSINDTRLTFSGQTSGTSLVDQPLRYGSNGRIELSCRGTVRANFTVSRIAGSTVLHETQVVDTPGPACGAMAGKASTDAAGGYKIVELAGNTLTLINGLAPEDSSSKSPDMLISTYTRASR